MALALACRGEPMTKYCIGLDAHMKTCTYRVKDHQGNLVDGKTIPSTREDLDLLLLEHPNAAIVLEATTVSRWIYDHLKTNGANVHLIHPVNIRRTLGRKSDNLDAGFLADAFMLGALRECYVPPADIQVLRELARSRTFLVRERTKIMNRIHAKLRGRGITSPTGSIFSKKNRAWLLEQDRVELPHLAQLIDHLSLAIRNTDQDVVAAMKKTPEIQLLESIPGFGPLTSLVMYSEVGDVSRFPSAEHLCAYFGIVPGESQSSEVMHRGRITRRGSSLARYVLVQAAWMHVTHCPASSVTKSHKRLAKRIGKAKAIVATARRLVKVSYHVLRDKRSFKADW